MDIFFNPWPWYVSGPLITLIMFVLLYLGKNFGISANLRTLCTMCGANKACDFFEFDWKSQRWNLLVILGAAIGGFLAANYLSTTNEVLLHADVVSKLTDLGFLNAGEGYMPPELFSIDNLSIKSIAILVIGGLLVGFGARYAGGCTSGHAISGLSDLQVPSLIAVIGFFVGGLLMVHIIFPLIF